MDIIVEEAKELVVLTSAGYVYGEITCDEIQEIERNWNEYVEEYNNCKLF